MRILELLTMAMQISQQAMPASFFVAILNKRFE